MYDQRAEAEAECEACRGREFGDCGGSECRYWRLTASQAEREEAARRDANLKRLAEQEKSA